MISLVKGKTEISLNLRTCGDLRWPIYFHPLQLDLFILSFEPTQQHAARHPFACIKGPISLKYSDIFKEPLQKIEFG
jgi:hypothetical protein